MHDSTLNRRSLLAMLASTSGLSFADVALGQGLMPSRAIPSTGETLPVLGLGSSKPVQQINTLGADRVAQILQALTQYGGSLIDTWPRNGENDAAFGGVLSRPEFESSLFVTTKIDTVGETEGISQFDNALTAYRRDTIDLTQIFSLTDVATHWPNLRKWKDEGRTRYIGVTVSEARLYEALENFVALEAPDFVQVNFSITERESEARLLPSLADRGIAVIINRPFMNGRYFEELEAVPLPEWTQEFDCHTWAQFSLKYILSNPDFTAVLTETSNPAHMAENAMTALGALPDDTARNRMREFIDAV